MKDIIIGRDTAPDGQSLAFAEQDAKRLEERAKELFQSSNFWDIATAIQYSSMGPLSAMRAVEEYCVEGSLYKDPGPLAPHISTLFRTFEVWRERTGKSVITLSLVNRRDYLVMDLRWDGVDDIPIISFEWDGHFNPYRSFEERKESWKYYGEMYD